MERHSEEQLRSANVRQSYLDSRSPLQRFLLVREQAGGGTSDDGVIELSEPTDAELARPGRASVRLPAGTTLRPGRVSSSSFAGNGGSSSVIEQHYHVLDGLHAGEEVIVVSHEWQDD